MSSKPASQPAPLPLNPYRATSEVDYDEYSGSPRSIKSFKFPQDEADESHGPSSPTPSSGSMGPPSLPAKMTRIPRLSLVPASRDQWQAHRNKLSAGGSSSSLKEMMEKKGGGAITTEIRVECLERRVRNSKEDAVGLAKDILSLCEEAASVKQWYSSLAEKSESLFLSALATPRSSSLTLPLLEQPSRSSTPCLSTVTRTSSCDQTSPARSFAVSSDDQLHFKAVGADSLAARSR
jgi:hypothetical protein